jgi:hypothetical protein
LGFPSIYVRLSYYISKINSEGMDTLFKNEVKQNRAMPSALTEPKITGTPAVNSTLKCDPGTWSSNTIKIETKWSTNQGWTFTDATNPGLSLGDSVAQDTQLTCTVTASSSNGKVVKTVSVLLPGKPTYSGYLSISGLSSYSVAKPGTNATCGGITWIKKPDTEEVKWFIGDTYDVKNPVISSNKTLPITNEIILNYAGKTLSCIIFARNSGGTVAAMAYVKLIVPVKPSAPFPYMSGISSYSKTTTGTVAQCSASSSYATDETVTYQWGYGTSSNASSLTNPIGSGPSLTITQSILDAINGKYLICQATATNIAGSASGYTTQSVTGPTPTPTASPTPTPTASPTPSPTPTASPTPTYATELISANLNPTTGFLPLGISGGPVKLGAVIGCAPILTVSSSYTHWGISPSSVDQNVGNGPGATVWKTQYENQRTITIDAALLSELSGKYLVCKIVHDDARFTGINLQPKGLASLFVPANAPTADTERPVIVAGSGVVEKASVKFGENFTITFRATDNVGIAGIQGIVYRPDSFPVFEGGNGPRISGSSTDGVYRSTLAIPATVNNGGIQNNPVGTYKVYANVQDSASNSSYVGGSYYIYIGTIEVTG